MGGYLQFRRLEIIGFVDRLVIDSTVRALLVSSIIENDCDISHRFARGHVHHRHAYSELAAAIPRQIAKNFRSPARIGVK